MFRFHEEHVAPIIEMSLQDFDQIRSSQQAEIARVRATLDRDVDSLPLEPIEVEASTTTTAQPIRG